MKSTYELRINGKTVCQVLVDQPSWFPLKTQLDLVWLRCLVARSVRHAIAAASASEVSS